MQLLLSQTHDVHANLALEESLLNAGSYAVLLWVNDPCVVIGRNQNPYREADVDFLRAQDIALARRASGGGAVYQDRGNLNYMFMADEPRTYEVVDLVIRVLADTGIPSCHQGRNDIVAGGAKVGGMAESQAARWLCHGTLLVDVDMHVLERALSPSSLKLAKHGVDSVRSRVRNLSDIKSNIAVESVIGAFERVLDCRAELVAPSPDDIARAQELREDAWLYGASPSYDVELERIVEGDLYRIQMHVRKGLIESALVTTDACAPRDLGAMRRSLEGIPFDPNVVGAVLRGC